MIAQALGPHDFIKGDATLVVPAVRAVHDKAPHATLAEVEGTGGGGKAMGTPPLSQMLGVGENLKHQLARGIEFAHRDDRSGNEVQIDTRVGCHSCVLSVRSGSY